MTLSRLDATAIRERAVGRWREILPRLGVDLPAAATQHGPCPACGGKDRFRFDDQDGRGTWFCNQCQPQAGDGLALVQNVKHCDFPDALQLVANELGERPNGIPPPKQAAPIQPTDDKARTLWQHTTTDAGRLSVYLQSRGLSGTVPEALRLHANVNWWEGLVSLGTFPAMVGQIQNRDGQDLGLHVTALAPDGSGKANVPQPKKTRKYQHVETIMGGAIRLDAPRPDAPLILAEGIETALALAEATGWPAWACVSANGLEAVQVPPTISTVLIGADLDTSETGHTAAAACADRLRQDGHTVAVMLPPGPIREGEKSQDWLDVFIQRGPEVVKAAGLHALATATMSGMSVNGTEEWPDIQPIKAELAPVDQLSLEIIPTPFRPWVNDVSSRMQCPPDFVAAGMLVMTGAVIGAGCGIRPKKHDDWTVVPNLWGGVVGRPSMLKTPAIGEAMKPLEGLELAAKQTYDAAIKDHEANLEAHKAQRESLVSEMKNLAKGKTSSKGHSMDGLKYDFAHLEEPKPPVWRRYKTNDATIEKMADLQANNPRGLLLFRDELIGLFATWDKENHENDRAFYLESWNGTNPWTTDRIGRGTSYVENLCVSLFGGIQPTKLSSYLYAAMRGRNNDGLVQRLQVLVYPDELPTWTLTDTAINAEAKRQAYQVVHRLASMDFRQYGAFGDEGQRIPYYRFNDAGQAVFYEWLTELEAKLRHSHDEPVILEHLGKYRSLMPALALVFHLVDIADGATAGPVSAANAKLAAAWCDYLESHARRIYGLVTNVTAQAAARLALKLQQGALPSGFTVRDVYRKEWGLLDDRQVIENACDELVSLGWLRERVTPPAPGQRGKTEYVINPKVRA